MTPKQGRSEFRWANDEVERWLQCLEPVIQGCSVKKVFSLRPVTLLKKRLWHGRFPLNFAKNTFFTEHLWANASECFMSYKYQQEYKGLNWEDIRNKYEKLRDHFIEPYR